jgi:hypothetical protein|tara:strand:- start:1621 stop:2019 length:399 start_codon:yes stop_codon:yes gene_type:complete
LEHGLDPDSELPELEAIGLMLEELVVAHKVDPANILVATGRRSLRDRIRREAQRGFACVPWEGRHDGDIGCETVYRVKGLERDAVILATALDNLSDHLLRVGMSRVIARPVVIGPKALSERSAGSGASVCRN